MFVSNLKNDITKKIEKFKLFRLGIKSIYLRVIINDLLVVFTFGIIGNLLYNLEKYWEIHTKLNPINELFSKKEILIETLDKINYSNINFSIYNFLNLKYFLFSFTLITLIFVVIQWQWKKMSFLLLVLKMAIILSLIYFIVVFNMTLLIIGIGFHLLFYFITSLHIYSIDNQKIYENRVVELESFQKILEEKETKKLVLIDGSWGTGKSFFVNMALKKKSLFNYHKINLDVLLFNDKKQIVSQTMNEINLILEKEGIRDNSAKKYARIVNYVSSKYSLNLNFLKQEKSLDEIEINLENDLKKLKNPVIIIVENLERTLEKNTVIDTLGFLHKIYSIAKDNIKLVLLADSSKIESLDGMKDYLDKFFDLKIKLGNVEIEEIIDTIDFDTDSKINKGNFINAFKEIQRILKNMNIEQYTEKYREFLINVIERFESSLSNSRNIKKIVELSDDTRKKYKNYYSNTTYFNEEVYQKLIVILKTYDYIIGIPKNIEFSIEQFEKYKSAKDSDIAKNNYNFLFFDFIFKIEELNYQLSNEDKQVFFNSIRRVIENKTETMDKKIREFYLDYINYFKMKEIIRASTTRKIINIENDKFNFNEFFKYLIEQKRDLEKLKKSWALWNNISYREPDKYCISNFPFYIKYLDKENKAFELFDLIFPKLKTLLEKNEITFKELNKWLTTDEILSIDKKRSEMLRPEGLFDLFDSVDDSSGIIRDKLLNIYLDDFICFTYKYLNFEKNILQESKEVFFKKFIIYFNNFYKDKERDIIGIVEHIVGNNIIINDIELKTYFRELLDKLKKLKVTTTVDDKKFLELVNNLKKIEYINVTKRSDSITVKKHMKSLEIVRGQLIKILDELFSLENDYIRYNEKILELLEETHTEFYPIIITKTNVFYEKNKNMLLSIEVMNKLLDNKITTFLLKIDPLLKEYSTLGSEQEEYEKEIEKIDNEIRIDYEAFTNRVGQLENIAEKIKNKYRISNPILVPNQWDIEKLKNNFKNEVFAEFYTEIAEEKRIKRIEVVYKEIEDFDKLVELVKKKMVLNINNYLSNEEKRIKRRVINDVIKKFIDELGNSWEFVFTSLVFSWNNFMTQNDSPGLGGFLNNYLSKSKRTEEK